MTAFDEVLARLAETHLLLQQDKKLPSVVGLLTGESLRTSWWTHPKAQLIFSVLSSLSEHPDVLFTKLIGGKQTLVHRALWPALAALGRAREPWQTRGLSPAAKRLLAAVDREREPVAAAGAAGKELQMRLLVTAREVHTASGRHELMLESWTRWSRRVACRADRSLPRARRTLEDATAKLGAPLDALPWR
jgi:hypothetical protein